MTELIGDLTEPNEAEKTPDRPGRRPAHGCATQPMSTSGLRMGVDLWSTAASIGPTYPCRVTAKRCAAVAATAPASQLAEASLGFVRRGTLLA